MKNLPPPFKFEVSDLVLGARRQMRKRVEGVTINLPFISLSVRPDDLEQKAAREIVIRLADKRVLNACECCDSCVEQAIASLQEIRSFLIDKQVELGGQSDGSVYLIIELMLKAIRQFFTFEEELHTANPNFPGDLHTRKHRTDLQPYFAGLEMLRGHLFRCLAQLAVVANTRIPKISEHMRYEEAWQLNAYHEPKLIEEGDAGGPCC